MESACLSFLQLKVLLSTQQKKGTGKTEGNCNPFCPLLITLDKDLEKSQGEKRGVILRRGKKKKSRKMRYFPQRLF